MARHQDRERAIAMRKKGMSYTQIKEVLKVSKSTLSVWLREMPLSQKRMRELRDYSAQRIEKTRETKRKKRITRLQEVYVSMGAELGRISDRELYVAGLFLYWGEGLKADPYTVMFTNTDPAMVKCFITWIRLFGVRRSKLKVYLHLYDDMNISQSISFWSKELSLSLQAFRRPYIKKSDVLKRRNYKGRYGHGTCNVYIRSRDLREKIGMGIARLREMYGGVAFEPSKAI